MPGKAAHFQVKLSGEWKDYDAAQDKILKRAFLAGHPSARYRFGKYSYEVDFAQMNQVNSETGKRREIRAPYKWKPPAAPIVPKGPTICVTVPPGGPGTVISVPHPRVKGAIIPVHVPETAKPGQTMLVPVPEIDMPSPSAPPMPSSYVPGGAPAAGPGYVPGQPAAGGGAVVPPPYPAGGAAAGGKPEDHGRSTGSKVAMAAGGVALVGGAVAGAVLGAHIADVGFDDAMADIGGGLGDAATAIGDGAEVAADWAGDAADSAGDFIMDLF